MPAKPALTSQRLLLEIVDWDVGVNLREFGWRRADVERIVQMYKLTHGQAVILYNNSRYWFGEGGGSHPPRCRIFWVWNGQGCTCIPPVDEGNRQVDYQHKLNDWIRRTFSYPLGMRNELFDRFETNYDAHVKRKAAAAAASRKRAVG